MRLRFSVGLIAVSVLAAGAAPAQQPSAPTAPAARTGRVVGRVVDAATGAGLSDVGIQIVGTTVGTLSGVDGRFALPAVPAGQVSIIALRIGSQAKTVTGVTIPRSSKSPNTHSKVGSCSACSA